MTLGDKKRVSHFVRCVHKIKTLICCLNLSLFQYSKTSISIDFSKIHQLLQKC